MSGTVFLQPVYTIVWTGTTLPFPFYRWVTLLSIRQHQMSHPCGSTTALYSGGLTLSLLFGEQV
jgi:hypothetical protein